MKWRFFYEGIDAGNGLGEDLPEAKAAPLAEGLAEAFREPYDMDRIKGLGYYDNVGFCIPCGLPYCWNHWHVSVTGFGTCPRGHGKSLDPHWHPLD
jgi:hypothetical protein